MIYVTTWWSIVILRTESEGANGLSDIGRKVTFHTRNSSCSIVWCTFPFFMHCYHKRAMACFEVCQ